MKITAIIPARYQSSRFPGKPLTPIAGIPMIVRVLHRAEGAREHGILDRVIVATDDERIRKAVEEAGGEARMTSPEHPTGTDRLAEVAAALDSDIIVNVQGDEPLLDPEMIRQVAAPLREDPQVPMGSLKSRFEDELEREDPNLGKVVTDEEDRAVTFTRHPLHRAGLDLPDYFNAERVNRMRESGTLQVFNDIGIYAYRREFLLKYPSLAQTPYERKERLEQLRALEHGYTIKVPTTSLRSIEVNRPEDVAKVEAALSAPEGRLR